MEYVKGRTLEVGQKVRVYMNLNRGPGSIFSIVDHKSGLVAGYAEQVTLTNVAFTVRESGRQRVLTARNKNVHAFLVGNLVAADETKPPTCDIEVYYNPYLTSHFTVIRHQTAILRSPIAHVINKRVWVPQEALIDLFHNIGQGA